METQGAYMTCWKKLFDSLPSAFPAIPSFFCRESSEKISVTSYIDNIYLGAGKFSPKLGK